MAIISLNYTVMRISVSIGVLASLVVLNTTLSLAASARTIEFKFPSDETYGQIYDDVHKDGGSRIEVARKRLGAARGSYRVTLPDKNRVVFEPNHRLYINPGKLSQFGADGIDIVRFTFIPMDEKESDYALNLCKNLHYLKSVKELQFNGSEIGDREVAALGHFANLNRLALSRTNVTGAVAKALAGLPSLKYVDLSETFLHPIDFAQMATLKSLLLLQLTSSNVANDDLKNIGILGSLLELHLDGTNIDDRGIKYLVALKNLKALGVRKTKVTVAGLSQLKDRQFLRLELPARLDTTASRAALKKLFPTTQLVFDKAEMKKNDNEINDMFRPLH